MKEEEKAPYIIYIIGLILFIWIGLLIAPFIQEGLIGILTDFSKALQNPFNIKLCSNSIKTVLVFILIYFVVIIYLTANKKNYRFKEEYGSAKWGNKRKVNKIYHQKPDFMNKILTKNVSIGLNGREHNKNLNVIVVGGSGSGKTRFYCKPNVLQHNTSYIILDPKGEITRDTGKLLEKEGYNIKVLDLINMEKSHCYNPFVYLRNDNDVQKLVTNLFKSTQLKGATTSDPFWDITASMLLLAIIFYLKYEAPEEEQNFPMVLEMLRAGEIDEEEENSISPLDMLFNQLEYSNPEHIALKYYRGYRSGAAKTLKSIQITLASRLEKFNLDSLASLTSTDELELNKFGEKKSVLFAIIPDNDTSFNFIVSILYTQLFQQLFEAADTKYNGRLPVHVHFIMDEFANVSLPDDFAKILSVMRSREVSVSIILQNMAQLKALFKDDWEGIVGNADTFLYLGGNEQSTHKYISEMLGKASIDINTHGKSYGRGGSYSTNYQAVGRELMTPDEVRMLNNKYALLFIRGERPIKDYKYNIMKHPNIKYTTDGKYEPYIHGKTDNSTGTIYIDFDDYSTNNFEEKTLEDIDIEVISSEDMDEKFFVFEERKSESNEEK